jgi:broad specificity phosphatase PhoE
VLFVLLHLVRHGRPLVDPPVPPREWQLDPAGIAEIKMLRTALPVSATKAAWFSSDERKAVATAQHLTDSAVQPVQELREAARSAFVQDQDAFADAVRRGLERPDIPALPGWEPLERTRQRVTDAVTVIISRCPGDGVLVGHGTAWTLLISSLADEPLPQNLPPMAMPDLLILDMDSRTVVSGWGDWRGHEREP